MPDNLCSPGQWFVRRLHGGLWRDLWERKPLRALHRDTDGDYHAECSQHADEHAHGATNQRAHTH